MLADTAGNAFHSWSEEVILWRVCVCVCVRAHVCVKLLQSCPNLCYPMHCNPPGSSVLEILQARLPSGSPVVDPEDLPNPAIEPAFLMSSALAGRFFTTNPT